MSSTPGQLEHVHDNATQRGADGAAGDFFLHHWMQILILLLALAGLLGNGAVLWLLGFRVPRTPFSVYILNRAAADALFLCFTLLLCIREFYRYLSGGAGGSKVFFLRYICVGLSLLAAISTERCLSALFPVWYRCRRPKCTSAAVCAVLWTLAAVLGAIFNFCPEVVLITYTVWFLLLTCVLCASSLTLLLRVPCCSRRRRPPRLSLLVLLSVLVFLLCGLPPGIFSFLALRFSMHPVLYWIFSLLACINSSVNPLIYFFVGRQRPAKREPLRLVLQRALREEQEMEGGMRDTLPTDSREV
ncbi:mas-related G-protein coupled receptor member X2-like [Sminthopsis crassicaudata]|uniref:mas-related G-protein coupled receptor member X2-like n=1 Tax=Sminthopsis crassicaudata TaxID=9301 RepID=UPI003D68E5B4